MNFQRSIGVTIASLACGLVLCSCAGDAITSASEVKERGAYHVYYAGDEVAGLPLEEVVGDPRSKTGWNFIYGHCEPPPQDESGCPPPLQIQVFSTCERWAGLSHRDDLYDFRGTKAGGHGRGGIEDPIEVFTGRTTVAVFSENPIVAKTAARQLRDIRAARPPARLPGPASGSLWGKLPCQDKPGS